MNEFYKRGDVLDFSDDEGNATTLTLIDYIEYHLNWYAVFTEKDSEDITIFAVENHLDESAEFLEESDEEALQVVYQIFLLKFPEYRS